MPANFSTRPWPLLAVLSLVTGPAHAGDGDLLGLMGQMQTFTHKLQLSIEARNPELANFYVHELEGTSETVVETVEFYDEQPIGQQVREMLLPLIERLEEPLAARDWAAGDARFVELVEACNTCHVVTGHGYIRVAPASGNPYAQDFAVAPENP